MISVLCRSFLLLVLILCFQACSNSEEVEEKGPSGPTIVKGNIGTSSEGQVFLKMRRGLFTYEDSVVGESSLDRGSFHISLELEDASYMALEAPSGGTLIYLRPGDSLVIRRGMGRKFRFEGTGTVPNTYIQKKKEFRDSVGRRSDSIFEVGKESFDRMLQERKELFHSFRKRHLKKEGSKPGERFMELERRRDRIELAVIEFSYPDIYSYENPNDTITFDQKHWDFLDTLDLNDPLFLHVPDFLSFAYDVANKYTLDNKGQQRNMSYREILFRTIQEEFEGRVREALLTYFILEQMKYAPERVMESFLERYREEVEDPEMRSFVEKELREKKRKEAL